MSKNILVTGATGNLGSKVCEILHQSGFHVIGTTMPGHKKDSEYADLYELDLSNTNDAEDFIEQLKKKYQSLKGILCLAGGFAMGNIQSTTSKDIFSMFNLNFATAYNIVKPVYQWMQETGGGQIILMGAKPAVEGGAFEVLPYALSKGNIFHFSDILNEKSKDSGITSTVIVPSIIDTPPNRSAMPHANFEDWVTPSQIANQIAWLLSDNGAPLRKTTLKIYGNS